MSIILSWENPQETYLPKLRRAEVWRSIPNKQSKLFKICNDSPWGVYEDTQGIDPAVVYEVHYMDALGQTKVTLRSEDIRRMARPIDLCKLMFSLKEVDGFPSAARSIEISNEPVGSNFSRRVLTNHRGYAEFFVRQGQRIQIRIDGDYKMLDCAVPAQSEITWEQLRDFGTILSTESRGLI